MLIIVGVAIYLVYLAVKDRRPVRRCPECQVVSGRNHYADCSVGYYRGRRFW